MRPIIVMRPIVIVRTVIIGPVGVRLDIVARPISRGRFDRIGDAADEAEATQGNQNAGHDPALVRRICRAERRAFVMTAIARMDGRS